MLRMMPIRLILASVFVFSLTGCVFTSPLLKNAAKTIFIPYKEPKIGPKAQVRVFNQFADISIYPHSVSIGETKKDMEGGRTQVLKMFGTEHKRKRLNMPFTSEDGGLYDEFLVPADRPIVVSMGYEAVDVDNRNKKYVCQTKYFRVQFEKNQNYSISLDRAQNRCDYKIEVYKDDGNKQLYNEVEDLSKKKSFSIFEIPDL